MKLTDLKNRFTILGFTFTEMMSHHVNAVFFCDIDEDVRISFYLHDGKAFFRFLSINAVETPVTPDMTVKDLEPFLRPTLKKLLPYVKSELRIAERKQARMLKIRTKLESL